ncbi:flavin reductase family protein [Cedecea colo]|uniref:Flavin reductase family protein n=1 Tax=Cedecea colo TaxID=2552946 RepID=A0ABX0VNA0_9ENTR|nr:flavin reductase family protein [Cedecea colo]NIY48437.1 flavin reductase family protein [Cedecea colo]
MSQKYAFPVEQIRRYLEPGPVVLLSALHRGKRNIMTLGWHTIMEFSPSLVGCMISAGNHSFSMIRESGECVINLPTVELADRVAKIGNCSGKERDKFADFSLTEAASQKVDAPAIDECYAHFECRLYDDVLIEKYNFFIFEVVHARVQREPQWPETLHYSGAGLFRTDGVVIDRHKLFTKVS